jgi:hypothetical protein
MNKEYKMMSNSFFLYIIILSLIVELPTIILAMKVKSKPFLKYLPSIIIVLLAVIFCVFLTLSSDRGGFIGIVYVVVAMITVPVSVISALTAAFDIARFVNRKNIINRGDINHE